MTDIDSSAGPLGTFEEENSRGTYDLVEFQADAELIRELGERLVGAEHIALAELVKNAYDADATRCIIRLERNRILVSDNGHGMSDHEFRNQWMRIGTTHKRERGISRELRRNVTGSKGVGRLSAQFLARRMQLVTVAKEDVDARAVHALVDWDKAVTAGDLTSAQVKCRVEPEARTEFPENSKWGTTVVLEGLKHHWMPEDVKKLGRQLWMLNSPFPKFGQVSRPQSARYDFEIEFQTQLPGFDETFESQMRAAINNFAAVIEGDLRREGDKAVSSVRVIFRDGEIYSEDFEQPEALIQSAKWQIRIYDLQGRQSSGIAVAAAREYFSRFGIMMFDAGFRLPHYGIENDWLEVERDHAGRLSRSKLLPERLQIERGMNDLPTQERMLGVVSIDTGREARAATTSQQQDGNYLQILVTRDRLVANGAYEQLKRAVRQSLDLYATRYRARELRFLDVHRSHESPEVKLRRIDMLTNEAVAKFGYDDTITELRDEIVSLEAAIQEQSSADASAKALLGPLAAAGMAALAIEHENRKAIVTARQRVAALHDVAERLNDDQLRKAVADLSDWIDRMESGRKIFAPLLEADERERVEVLPASGTLREVVANVRALIPGVTVTFDIPRELELPAATFAEWHALFQNVILNAANAMLDTPQPQLRISGSAERRASIRVSDMGTGVDVESQHELFEPFTRRHAISEERAALGLGGHGLGLTIVRMIADQRGCTVAFVEPEPGWRTTFELKWVAR